MRPRNGIRAFEDAVRQPVVTQELPDVFDRIELGTFRRQQVPAGLIDQEYGVCAGRDGGGEPQIESDVYCNMLEAVFSERTGLYTQLLRRATP
jgi:hypothetical protein